MQVGSTDRDRVIKPAAQIRHLGGQQPSAGNASNVHPVNPRAYSLHSGQQSETVQNGHAVRLQSQGGANLRRSLRPLDKRHPRQAATRLSTKLAVSPPIPAPTTTAWSTVHTVDAVDFPPRPTCRRRPVLRFAGKYRSQAGLQH